MDTLTYSIIIAAVFFIGVFVFTYFETPRETLNRGVKKLKTMPPLNLKKITKGPFIIPGRQGKHPVNKEKNVKVYVHEY